MNTPQQYQNLWDTMVVRDSVIPKLKTIVEKIISNKARYEKVVEKSKIPWQVVAAIHNMESDMLFTRHLHNGDPLTARTTHVPAGRPLGGNPPFTWEESAADALHLRGMDSVTDWSIPHMLLVIEGYNGFGYSRRNLPSPYLWSGSNIYTKGKYVADGKFDPDAISKQIGAALIIKELI